MSVTDVTKKVDFRNPDDETLPITKCVCGSTFEPWTFTISIYDDSLYSCPACGRKFYFRNEIHVFEVRP